MKQIKVYDANTKPVCVNRGWIVCAVIFGLLSAVMALLALHNAKLIDCEHVYPENGKWFCIAEVEGV